MDEINTEHNMKSICRPAVAQWTESAWLAKDKREFETGKAQIFFYHKIVQYKFYNTLIPGRAEKNFAGRAGNFGPVDITY